MAADPTQIEKRFPAHRAPQSGSDERHDEPRHRRRGGASAAIGETDVFLYRSYALVERLRRAVADRANGS